VADLQVAAVDTGSGRPDFVGRFTDRRDGLSRPPYDDANLALHVGDDPEAVAQNRMSLQDRLGVPIVWMEQVHGDAVAVVDGAAPATISDVDALVTRRTNIALAVLVADCVPVLMVDPEAGVVAAVHAGRRGLVAGVVVRTVTAMVDLGAHAERVQVWLGPSICGRCYELPAAMRDEVEEAAPGSATTTARGTPGVDLRAGLRRQLVALGSAGPAVRDVGPCTAESADHYSHRRDGVTGRFVGVAVLK
jgi:YfiH family protein